MISNTLDNIRLLFKKEKKPFLQLKSILGFYPHNLKLYHLALMHKSVAYHEAKEAAERKKTEPKKEKYWSEKRRMKREEEKRKKSGKQNRQRPSPMNNERLEYLGDAMLGAIVADILYKHYGNKQEGFLTSLRSKIVCRKSLNKLAVELGLDKLIQHTGAITTGHNSFMNGNAFEAFIGAIYLDRGYKYCYRFMEDKVFKHHINIDAVAKHEENFKSAFIEWCQKYQYTFEFCQKEHRENNGKVPVFHSEVKVEGIPCGTGTGYSKKESDQEAAKQALKKVKQEQTLLQGIKNAHENRVTGQKDSK